MTVGTDEDVLRLQVTIDDASCVQALHALDDFRSIESRTIPSEPAPARQLCREVTARMEVL